MMLLGIRRLLIWATRHSYMRTLFERVMSLTAIHGKITVIPVQGRTSELIVQLGRLGDSIKMHLSELFLHTGIVITIKVR